MKCVVERSQTYAARFLHYAFRSATGSSRNDVKIDMNNKPLQLKYGLGIIHSVPWLGAAQGKYERHPIEPAINMLVKNRVNVTVEHEFIIPSENSTFDITIPDGKTVTITERADNPENIAQRIHLTIGEGSRVTYTIQTNGGTKAVIRNVTCEQGSLLNIQESAVNTEDLISHVQVSLGGEGAAVEYASAFFGIAASVIDTSQTVRHLANNTSSNLVTRGVLDHKAKGFYRATIDIAKGAKHCSGHQHEKTLLLSDNARMMAVPALEIANNEVSCSHAVATTHLRPENLFYVQSRGIGEEAARNAMIRAHLAPVLGACPEDVRNIFGIDHH